MALEINDEELRKINKVHADLQTRYTGRCLMGDISAMIGLKANIKEEFHKIGFEVNVTLKNDPVHDCVIPDVEFVGRTDKKLEEYLKTETDWERREYDLKKTSVEELKKTSANIQLLE